MGQGSISYVLLFFVFLYISEAMGHSISSGAVTDLYIQTYPLAQQIQFNSKLLKVGEQAMLMDQLQDLSIEELRAAIEIVRSRQKEQKI